MFFLYITKDTDIASYADNSTPYVSADNIDGIVKFLEEASKVLFKWFSDNLMKINADICHLLVITNNTVTIKIGNFDITNSKSEKLLGLKFDHKLSFDDEISELCKKACRKMHALSRVACYMNLFKKKHSRECVL